MSLKLITYVPESISPCPPQRLGEPEMLTEKTAQSMSKDKPKNMSLKLKFHSLLLSSNKHVEVKITIMK